MPMHTAIRRYIETAGELVGRPDRYRLNPAAGALPDIEEEEEAVRLESEHNINRDDLGEDEAQEVKKLLLNFHAGRVVVDEAHFAKSPRSTLNQMIRMMSYDELYLASATMLSNSIRDFFGYVELMWRDELPFAYDPATKTTPASTLYDLSTWKQLTRGIDTEAVDAERIHRSTTDPASYTPPTDPKLIAAATEYRQHIEKTGEPVFLANPRLYADFAAETQHSPAFAQNAVGALMSMVSVRRGMMTPMELPDGTFTWPAKGIPPMTVYTRCLGMPKGVGPKLKPRLNALHAHLTVNVPREKAFRSRTGNSITGPSVQFNPNALRRLALGSTNIHNLDMTSPIIRTTQLLANRNVKSIMGTAIRQSKSSRTNRKKKPLLRPSVDDSSQPLSPLEKKSREAEARRQRPEASAGTAEMNRVAMEDPTKGLQWAFYLTRSGLRDSFPSDPISQVRYIAFDSPKYCYALSKVIKCYLEGRRCLVYVNNPITGAMMLAMLEALGIRTLTVQSKHSQGERDAAVKKFNSATYPVSAMITSMKLSSLGVNFHHACWDGLIMEYPHNMGTQIQALGRLWRMQQLKAVIWEILHQRHSYDAFLDARNCEKLAHNMAAEGNIDPAITDQYRIICAYELIRAMMGHESNQYARLRVVWHKMDSNRVRDEGFFYSAVANFLFRNPGKQSLISPETIGDIAARWQLGTPLTIEHIEPGHPSYRKPLDRNDPLRVQLTSAREQEEAYNENMLEIANADDGAADREGNENSDLFASTEAFQDEPEEEDGAGGPGPLHRTLAITGPIGSLPTRDADGDVEMEETVRQGKRKRQEEPQTPTKAKVPRRQDVISAHKNKL
ncbi:Uncharacterized protein LW94_1843 [Fusarium fujikuroi]|nr:Uncharacterized protein LW94_1843 [Fusarium fujikuroi]